ncbi:hypothetical protein V8G54_025146 [Vigna mungo]|uniref:Uncharacterized protein n=1 Tax=Vigna mungo TaxID=3915 RepID=A0AAQ3N7L3_VIGMU
MWDPLKFISHAHHAGYYSLPRSKAARMFYFFFESRKNKNDPVVIWLTGGPGCGSELAMFYENGPFHITKNLSLTWNDYGWDQASNIIFVDQPTGTGFSYSSDNSVLRRDETGVGTDLYDFLQEFFKAHPNFVKNDFYIFLVNHMLDTMFLHLHLGLTGLAIGNGFTNPAIQYEAYPDFALQSRIITEAQYDILRKSVTLCERAIKNCGEKSCLVALEICENIFGRILSFAGNINYFDIRKKCEGSMCYNFTNVETLLNMQKVKSALGVRGDLKYNLCSIRVHNAMAEDTMRNLEVRIPALLEDGIKLLVYAGEKRSLVDVILILIGNSRWVHAMKWSGQKAFGKSPVVKFVVDGAVAASLRSHGPLSFLKVHEAEHLVPMDQPKVSLQMFKRWMGGKLKNKGDN